LWAVEINSAAHFYIRLPIDDIPRDSDGCQIARQAHLRPPEVQGRLLLSTVKLL
jgi:hypothetical protein